MRETFGFSQRFACQVVGQPRSTQRYERLADTPDDPDAELRQWLRDYAGQNPRKGHRRAWASLCHDEGMRINRKKVWRLWREEDLQVAVRTRRKRAGESTAANPPDADAPNRVWGIDFQHDSTRDGRGFKIASMVDEHTRESLLDLTSRSITAEVLTVELDRIIADRGAPSVLRCDNGPEFISQVLNDFCGDHETKIHYIPPGQPWRNGHAESFNNRCRDECLNMNDFNDLLHAQVVISDWKCEYNARHRHSSLGYLTPREYSQRCKH